MSRAIGIKIYLSSANLFKENTGSFFSFQPNRFSPRLGRVLSAKQTLNVIPLSIYHDCILTLCKAQEKLGFPHLLPCENIFRGLACWCGNSLQAPNKSISLSCLCRRKKAWKWPKILLKVCCDEFFPRRAVPKHFKLPLMCERKKKPRRIIEGRGKSNKS